MKYLAVNPDQIECTECSSRFNSDVQFCGFCGAPATRKTIALNAVFKEEKRKTPLELEALTPQPGAVFIFEDDDFDDFDGFEKPKNKILAMGVIATSVLAVGIMGFILFLQASDSKKPVEIANVELAKAAVAKAEVAAIPVKKVRFSMTAPKKSVRELSAEGMLITIHQAKDSRYKNVDKRAKSVMIRLNHAMEKVQKAECGDTCFVAVKNGKHSEVRFINKDGAPFRLLDVTQRDARREKTTAHIRANLIVDQLNALFETKVQPLAMLNND